MPEEKRDYPGFCISKIRLKGRLIKSLRDLIKHVGVSRILRLRKLVQRGIRDYLNKHEKISSRFSRLTLRANFAVAKFGIIHRIVLKKSE